MFQNGNMYNQEIWQIINLLPGFNVYTKSKKLIRIYKFAGYCIFENVNIFYIPV